MAEFFGLNVHFFSSSARKEICSPHIIYCKKHTVRCDEPAAPARRTLFSLGWPPYCLGSEVEAVFSRAGCVTATYLQNSPGPLASRRGGGGGKVVYVVFSQPEELDQALHMCTSEQAVRCNVGRIGVERWCEEYASTRLKMTILDSAVNHGMGRHEAEQRQTRKKHSQPDEEGWVTVARRTQQQSGHHESRKKRKAKELVNFYHFQQREGQREAVADLRRKFQKDKEKVAELRARRRFRPF